MTGRSIRGSLMAWFSLLLSGVLLTFGTVLHGRAREAIWAGVDTSLVGSARALFAALDTEDEDGWELDLSDDYLQGMTQGGYFAIWDDGGTVMRRGGEGAPDRPSGRRGFREQGAFRVLEESDSRGFQVVLARSIDSERERLAALTGALIGIGLGVLSVGLLGGWWLARRSTRPIEEVSLRAGEITARDLSARLSQEGLPLELAGVVEAFDDVLERLEVAFERQARFTADASHELRTPLSVIHAQAELALERERTVEDYRTALETCRRSAERMSGIVSGLLTLARFDAGHSELKDESVALAPLIESTLDLLRSEAEANEVEIGCELTSATVPGDRDLLAEVVTNLVSNAIRYNRPGGRVDVRLSAEADRAVLSVSDTGRGIPSEALPRLFDRFFRVDAARSRSEGGSGLGLAICRRIVEAHGGTIEVESEVGSGSVFRVRLPREG